MAHSAFRHEVIDMEGTIKLVVMSAQGLDHRAAGCLAIVTRPGAVLRLRLIEFVAFGADNPDSVYLLCTKNACHALSSPCDALDASSMYSGAIT